MGGEERGSVMDGCGRGRRAKRVSDGGGGMCIGLMNRKEGQKDRRMRRGKRVIQ